MCVYLCMLPLPFVASVPVNGDRRGRFSFFRFDYKVQPDTSTIFYFCYVFHLQFDCSSFFSAISLFKSTHAAHLIPPPGLKQCALSFQMLWLRVFFLLNVANIRAYYIVHFFVIRIVYHRNTAHTQNGVCTILQETGSVRIKKKIRKNEHRENK